MKKIIFILAIVMTFANHAFSFNPDPTRYEYIGQKKLDGVYYFYEIASAKADGQKGVLVILQADSKNRTLRYYRNTVIDPDSMIIRATYCELCDYYGNILETFNLPAEGIKYQKGDLTDKIYQDLLNKGIVSKPVVYYPDPVPVPVPRPVPPIPEPNPEPDWRIGLPGGEEAPAEDTRDWKEGLPE